MSETHLFIGILLFIILLIICIHIYDRFLVKEIEIYEKRLEKKGIFKRHFIPNKSNKSRVVIKCKSCSKEFTVKDTDIPPNGRMVKCSFCFVTWRQMPTKI